MPVYPHNDSESENLYVGLIHSDVLPRLPKSVAYPIPIAKENKKLGPEDARLFLSKILDLEHQDSILNNLSDGMLNSLQDLLENMEGSNIEDITKSVAKLILSEVTSLLKKDLASFKDQPHVFLASPDYATITMGIIRTQGGAGTGGGLINTGSTSVTITPVTNTQVSSVVNADGTIIYEATTDRGNTNKPLGSRSKPNSKPAHGNK